MNLAWIVLIVATVYFFLIFVVSRFIIPFMGFGGFVLPQQIPEEIKAAIAELESHTSDQQSYLQAVYKLVMDKNNTQWHHTRFFAAVRLPRAFVKDLGEIWQTQDFIYCTAMNYLAATMLVGSRFFKPEDIKVRHVFVNFFIHQYLKVRVGEKWVDFDPAGTGIRGRPIGVHLVWFG